jgi:hypothetical protein
MECLQVKHMKCLLSRENKGIRTFLLHGGVLLSLSWHRHSTQDSDYNTIYGTRDPGRVVHVF